MAKKLRDITEKDAKKVVFAFGRFNPPTSGHEKLVDSILSVARRRGAENRIFISNSQDSKKNPLQPQDKLRIMKSSFPKANIVQSRQIPTPFHAFDSLREEGFEEIIMVAGSDRERSRRC